MSLSSLCFFHFLDGVFCIDTVNFNIVKFISLCFMPFLISFFFNIFFKKSFPTLKHFFTIIYSQKGSVSTCFKKA